MRIVIAPDSFKESLTAVEACTAMAAGVRDILPDAEIIEIPMADGGEGTADAFATALDLGQHTKTVAGPLAEAAGIHLVAPEHRDIWAADTRGVGQLLNAALDTAPQKLIIGLGGSVTTDGGLGLLAALGVTAVDAAGEPTDLRHAARITGERDPPLE